MIRRIQIIGEAVRHLSRELLVRMPDFPAKQASGMRNVLVHDYDALNLERLWETATQDIPVIKRVVENHLQHILIPTDPFVSKARWRSTWAATICFFCRVARPLRRNPDFEKIMRVPKFHAGQPTHTGRDR